MNKDMIDIDDYLRLGIPKKGRLYEKTVEYLKKTDLYYERKQRSDIAICKNYKIAIIFLPAKDIPLYVANNTVNLGITGQDIVQESGVEVIECERLGFGKCTLSLLEPESRTLDLEKIKNLRIATTFPYLTDWFLKKNYPNIVSEIVHLSGSVEIACNLGLADMVVDLVDSGATMQAAHLKVSKKILTSETVLITNAQSQEIDFVQKFVRRIKGVLTAEKFAIIEYNIKRENLQHSLKYAPGNTSPTILSLEDSNWVAVKAMIAKSDMYEIMESISHAGAKDILIYHINNCRL